MHVKSPGVIGKENSQVMIISDPIIFNVPIYEIIEEKCQVKVIDSSVYRDKVVIDGIVKVDIIYKGQKDSSNEGVICYHEEEFDFGGIVKIEGALPEDSCIIKEAAVSDYKSVIPQTRDTSSNILTARIKFIADILLEVTRERPGQSNS
ncbi:MAG: DUF3794 domain-containing protein [Clostridiales bacterium]|nr:DUF3794 domain-containing protein [Clostridiales bacterium]MCF8022854.1 DUF3794 domain-containing protein [Clostridiales bacterium]